MNLQDLDRVNDLRSALFELEVTQRMFEHDKSETVRCSARGNGYSVQMPDVARETVASAIQERRADLVAQLAELGVTVADAASEQA